MLSATLRSRGGAGDATYAPNVLDSVSSFCPPANLVFHQTVERIHVGKKFGDIPRGIFIVRGENVVLLGEIVSGTHAHAHACRRIVLPGDTLGISHTRKVIICVVGNYYHYKYSCGYYPNYYHH